MILEILSICAVILFGLTSIIISLKDDRSKKSLHYPDIDPKPDIDLKKEPIEDKNLKDDFTMAVHELRSPLTSIKDSSELLLNHKYTLKEDEKEQFLKMINRQSKLLLDQVGSILDVAKLKSGTFTLNKKPDTVDDLIYDRIKIFIPQAERKNILLTCSIDDHLPQVDIDKIRIGQVLNNLISNSIKFTPEGGKIIVSANVVADSKGDGQLQISVADTGLGIPKEEQSKIFTKFYQVKPKGIREEKEGSGLGLYITKKIIDKHGGSIAVDSEDGQGTIMTITLPVYNHGETKVIPQNTISPEVHKIAN